MSTRKYALQLHIARSLLALGLNNNSNTIHCGWRSTIDLRWYFNSPEQHCEVCARCGYLHTATQPPSRKPVLNLQVSFLLQSFIYCYMRLFVNQCPFWVLTLHRWQILLLTSSTAFLQYYLVFAVPSLQSRLHHVSLTCLCCVLIEN